MDSSRLDQDVAALRRFNRLYTLRFGLLNPQLDGSPFTLAEARVLYELAQRPASVAADLGRELGLDRAQLSRTLKRFADRGLVETANVPDGGRRRPIALTEAGRAAFAALDHNTRAVIGSLLASLSPANRTTLVRAAHTICGVFAGRPEPALALRDPEPGDLGWIIHRQAILYAEEFGWNRDYEALVARILADFVQSFDAAREAAWVADLNGQVAGSVLLVQGDAPGSGKLRLLYVEPQARGRGVGAALVSACVARARAVGYGTLVLWTNSVLVSARRLYERAGFVMVDETPHRAFGKDLIGQTWSLDLRATAVRSAAIGT